jgi:hypothetical protein
MITAEDLHRAAELVSGAGFEMDQVAAAGAQFLRESQITPYDDAGLYEAIAFDPKALGYGIMLGYLAARRS